ncbi:MAG: geranylgeranylglycerol-phosphate geranylgeranyltransferase [Paludibacteraceae bacterium]|nr:geranylgeranylglycerol-phosphate geranylgeranyltransferase [Paludibacteraceae bacterium]
MDKLRDYLLLVRWQNLLMTMLVMYVMEKWVATPLLRAAYFGEQLPWWLLTLLIAAVVLIAAGGYVINDYFDVKIDAINRPDRLIVTRSVSKQQAMRLFQVLTAAGIVCGLAASWVLHSWVTAVIIIFVPGLLWFYSASYKRQLVVGNLIVALTAALCPLLIAVSNVAYLKLHYSNVNGINVLEYLTLPRELYLWIGGFAAFAFVATLIREIIKDLQDQMGDRELECHTLPVVLGEQATKIIVTVLLLLMAGAIVWLAWAVIPFPHVWRSLHIRYVVLGLLIPIACELWLLWSARISSDYRTAQVVMKFVMVMGVLYSYVINQMV